VALVLPCAADKALTTRMDASNVIKASRSITSFTIHFPSHPRLNSKCVPRFSTVHSLSCVSLHHQLLSAAIFNVLAYVLAFMKVPHVSSVSQTLVCIIHWVHYPTHNCRYKICTNRVNTWWPQL